MRTLYLDCISGIAGDMALSALVDAGADPAYIVHHLSVLPIDPFTMEFVGVDRRGISAKWLKLSFDNEVHEHKHRDDHGHVHTHSHEHEHAHGHVHTDSHEHGHAHDHIHHDEHSHEHGHDHHSHDHDHKHGHAHNHVHTHSHEHEHAHNHNHNDEHSHEHHHGHSHDHHHHDHHHTHGEHDHHHDHGHHHDHRKASDIIGMIENSSLPERVKTRSLSIFHLIAEAEGKIHGMNPADVHFHEVGAMDSILDIIGVCLALESLDVSRIIVSPVPTGTGRLRMAHGLYPIPAPATAELLRGVPLSPFTAKGELTTPTGAGIVKALAAEFGTLPAGTIDRIGYGAGTKNFEHPNVLRAVLYKHEEEHEHEQGHGQRQGARSKETVVVLEAQVDDSTGERLGYAMEKLFEAGALDVYYTPVYMKKNRPGVLVSVLCYPSSEELCEETLLAETSTFGVRHSEWTRKALERQWMQVDTRYGTIRVKQALDGGRIMRQAPEYEDAAQAARSYGVSLETVYNEVYLFIGRLEAKGEKRK